jgi:Bacterial Ig-like domain (group 3)
LQAAYPAQCNGSNPVTAPGSACIFNDVTVGNNVVPGESGSNYQAAPGFDLTTGLGSVNISNLLARWNTVTFNPTTTTLGLTPDTAIPHGQPVTVNITVAPNTGTGKPSGDVSLLALAAAGAPIEQAVGGFTLNATGRVSESSGLLPGGTYDVIAHYAGDATYAPSDSDPVRVTVTAESSTTTETIFAFDQNGNSLPLTSVPFGSFVYVRSDVRGTSGEGTPTGTVTFTDSLEAIPGGGSFLLNSEGNTANPNGIAFDTGTHVISAHYLGDASFNGSSTAHSQSVVVSAGFSAFVPSAGLQVTISAPGATGSTQVTVATSTGFTGTINLACAGLPSKASCGFVPSSVTGNGTSTQTTVGITVTTVAPATALRSLLQTNFLARLSVGAGLFFSVVLVGGGKFGRKRGLPVLLMLLLTVVLPACGGGGGGGGQSPPPSPGTPTGSFNVVVNATSGSTTSSSGFTLVVQ